jgi:hypothetical protein
VTRSVDGLHFHQMPSALTKYTRFPYIRAKGIEITDISAVYPNQITRQRLENNFVVGYSFTGFF